MKNILNSLLLLLVIYNTTQASIIEAGPRIGISTTHIELDSNIRKSYNPKVGLGFQIGGMTRINLPLIYIQPELLFSNSKAKYHIQNQENTLSYNKIDVPIMVGMKFLGLARIQVGPIFSYLISAKDTNIDITLEYKKRISAGYQAGIGVDIYKFFIDLKYEGSFNKISTKLGGNSIEHRENLVIFSIGVNLL